MTMYCYRDFDSNSLSGMISIPKGDVCQMEKGIVYWHSMPICLNRSQARKDHFCRHDDGAGPERGRLIQAAVRHPERLADYIQPSGIGYRLELYDETIEKLKEAAA